MLKLFVFSHQPKEMDAREIAPLFRFIIYHLRPLAVCHHSIVQVIQFER